MKVKADFVATGIVDYAEEHILPMVQGWQVFAGGFALEWIRGKADQIVPVITGNETLKALGLIDANGMIDIDEAITTAKATANKHGKLAVEVPMFGKIALTESDFDVIGESIKAAAGK